MWRHTIHHTAVFGRSVSHAPWGSRMHAAATAMATASPCAALAATHTTSRLHPSFSSPSRRLLPPSSHRLFSTSASTSPTSSSIPRRRFRLPIRLPIRLSACPQGLPEQLHELNCHGLYERAVEVGMDAGLSLDKRPGKFGWRDKKRWTQAWIQMDYAQKQWQQQMNNATAERINQMAQKTYANATGTPLSPQHAHAYSQPLPPTDGSTSTQPYYVSFVNAWGEPVLGEVPGVGRGFPLEMTYGQRFKWGFRKLFGMGLSTLWTGIWFVVFVGTYIHFYGLPTMEDFMGMASRNKTPAEIPTTRFSDIRGCDDAKNDVAEVVEYLKNPERFTRLGGKMPKGILLLGPPGVGKTLLARAVAGEAGVPFFSANGSEFEEKFVGVGAKRMRELFEEAKKKAPAIIFIDEIDSVGGKRSSFENPLVRLSLNQLLTLLDGFEESTGLVVMAATNYAQRLDSALTRPGRFDRHVTVPTPDIKGRKDIIELYAKQLRLAPDIDLDGIARATPGFTGADLFNLLNSAALYASRTNKEYVTQSDIEYAKDKLLMGSERRSAKTNEETRRHVAFYEGGRSVVVMLTPRAEPLHKVTVIQRGTSLGMTSQQQTRDIDVVSMDYQEYLAAIDSRMGGRAAEELIYGPQGISTGAEEDLQVATMIARDMVMRFGYGTESGPVSFTRDYGRSTSPEQKAAIDQEVQTLLNQSYQRVKTLLMQHEEGLKRVAEALLQYETLDGKQARLAMEGKLGGIHSDQITPPSTTTTDTDSSNTPSNGPAIPA